ncbi:MAG: amidohydrolase family protein [Clostridiales bacterium]|nr:amidohydrolase family protein [Clostridiales bacterium]
MEKRVTRHEFPYGEGHMHIFMNGVNYKEAVKAQECGVDERVIRKNLEAYHRLGISWLRDGGDIYGTSKKAIEIAPEYGITYRTPVFAIHREGHYGGIVGRAYRDLKEYRKLVRILRKQGGHFVKIMISGIMDFDNGGLTEESLSDEEIRELIHIAHEEGFPVMAHTNGNRAVRAAALAGVDSIEHGNFCDEDGLEAMASSDVVWVPTVVTVKNLLGDGRFPEKVLENIWEGQKKNLHRAYELGVRMALGSDGGAYRVLHGQGLLDEYQVFAEILGEDFPQWEERIQEGDRILKEKF